MREREESESAGKASRPDPPRGPDPPLGHRGPGEVDLVPLSLFFYAGILVLTALGAWWLDQPIGFASEAARARGVHWGVDTAWGIGAALAVVSVSRVVTRSTAWGDELGRGLAELVGRRSWQECWMLAIASGIAEEALFRGVLQPWLGYAVATVLFALAHFAPRRDLLAWTGFALLAGVVLGALFEISGNLVAPIVAHVGINAVNLRWLSLRYPPVEVEEVEPDEPDERA